MAGKTGGSRKGMGFPAAAASAAKKAGVPVAQGKAMVAATARKASPAAKKANPNLMNVLPAKKAAAKKTAAKKTPSKGAGGY